MTIPTVASHVHGRPRLIGGLTFLLVVVECPPAVIAWCGSDREIERQRSNDERYYIGGNIGRVC